MYDLLIKGGRVIDPAQNLDDKLDVAISGDKIAAVAKDIPSGESKRVIDAGDKIVTPGLIDSHCHVYGGVIKDGVVPDEAGVKQGVTTVVDAGSAGQAIFDGFPRYVIPSSRTTIYCYLHLGSQGITVMPELRDWEEIDLDATADTIESYRDIIKGIKLRLVGNIVSRDGIKVVKMAKKIARQFRLPIIVHIGDRDKQVPATLTREFLPLMESGDILCHVFTGNQGRIVDSNSKVLPELREAMARGVVTDVANGRSNLSFEVARKGMAQGIFPTTLSTDVIGPSLTELVYGLTVTMSKFLALGLDLKQIIEMTTINPARVLGIADRRGSLRPGMDADVSVLEVQSGLWRLTDSEQQFLEVPKLIAPSLTVKSGEVIPAQPAARPQLVNR